MSVWTHINHPVGDLAHAQARSMTQLFFLLFARVGMIGMAVQPSLEEVSSFLGELASFTLLRTIDKG